MRMLANMFAFWDTSKSFSLRSSKSSSAARSWQNALTTFWPFMTSSMCPSTTPSSICCAMKKRAELEPSSLVRNVITATPAMITRPIQAEK